MAEFNLISSYQPAGDQPKAIGELISSIRQGEKKQVLLGITGSGKTLYGGRHKRAPGGRTALIAITPGCGISRVRPRWSCGCILIIMDTT